MKSKWILLAGALLGVRLLAAPTPVLAAQGECGQPLTNGPKTSDALAILKAAVGQTIQACINKPCICDVDGGGSIKTSDALLCLKKSVGQNVDLRCKCQSQWIGSWSSYDGPYEGGLSAMLTMDTFAVEGSISITDSDCLPSDGVLSGELSGTSFSGLATFGGSHEVVFTGHFDADCGEGDYSAGSACENDQGSWQLCKVQ